MDLHNMMCCEWNNVHNTICDNISKSGETAVTLLRILQSTTLQHIIHIIIKLLVLILAQVGKQTPIAVRFSTVGGESGSADTARCQKRQTDDC